MGRLKLPKRHRPGLRIREVEPGVDLPCWFLDGMKALDTNLHFVWHPWRFLYDDVMNEHTGPADDPRFCIGRQPGFGDEECWGFILKGSGDDPLPENKWHVWRLCEGGWAHIMPIDMTTPAYLKFALDRLYLHDQIVQRYGFLAWNDYLEEEQAIARSKKIDNLDQLFTDTTKENSWLLRSAMDAFQKRQVGATAPTRDVITSYANQSNHSRITRPLTDKEGGLVVPDQWSHE